MRQAGSIPDHQHAQRFVDFLKTLGINARADKGEAGSTVWIIDEDQIDRGKQELADFLLHPEDERYVKAGTAAAALRREDAARVAQAKRNMIDMRRHWDAPSPGRIPLTLLLMFVSIAVAVLTGFGDSNPDLQAKLKMSATPGDLDNPVTRGLEEVVERGEIWRLFTPIFLHFGLLHVAFNMYWLYLLGGLIESRVGWWRLALLVVVAAATSNLGQYFSGDLIALIGGQSTEAGGPNFGGFSGVGCALFGYVWLKSKYDPGSGMFMAPQSAVIFLLWLFLCMFGVVGNIANTAHLVGLVVGLLLGLIPAGRRRP